MKRFIILTIFIFYTENIYAVTLQEAIISAYENNSQIKYEIENVKSYKNDKLIAQAEWLPKITASAGVNREAIKSSAASPEKFNYATSSDIAINLNQSLFSGGSTIAKVNKQDYLLESAKLNYFAVQQNVFLNVISAYMEMLEAGEVLNLQLANQKAFEEHYNAAQQRFELGEATKTDVEQARSKMLNAKSGVIEAEGNLLVKKEIFKRETYLEPIDLSDPVDIPQIPNSLDEFYNVAINDNISMKALKLQVDAAKEDIKINFGNLLPSINLRSELSYANNSPSSTSSNKFDSESKSITISVSYPLYQGGADYLNYKKSKYNSRKQELNQRYENDKLREELISAWHNHNMYLAKLDATLSAMQAAQTALQGTKQEVEVGSRNILDLLDSETNLLDAQLKFIQSKKDKIISNYKLLALKGSLIIKDLNLGIQEYII